MKLGCVTLLFLFVKGHNNITVNVSDCRERYISYGRSNHYINTRPTRIHHVWDIVAPECTQKLLIYIQKFDFGTGCNYFLKIEEVKSSQILLENCTRPGSLMAKGNKLKITLMAEKSNANLTGSGLVISIKRSCTDVELCKIGPMSSIHVHKDESTTSLGFFTKSTSSTRLTDTNKDNTFMDARSSPDTVTSIPEMTVMIFTILAVLIAVVVFFIIVTIRKIRFKQERRTKSKNRLICTSMYSKANIQECRNISQEFQYSLASEVKVN